MRRGNNRRIASIHQERNPVPIPAATGGDWDAFAVTASGDLTPDNTTIFKYELFHQCYVTTRKVDILTFDINALVNDTTESANLKMLIVDVDTSEYVGYRAVIKDDDANDIVERSADSDTYCHSVNGSNLGTHHCGPGSDFKWTGEVTVYLDRTARVALVLFELDTVGAGTSAYTQDAGDTPDTYTEFPIDDVEFGCTYGEESRMNAYDNDLSTWEGVESGGSIVLPTMDSAEDYYYKVFVDTFGRTPTLSSLMHWDYTGAI